MAPVMIRPYLISIYNGQLTEQSCLSVLFNYRPTILLTVTWLTVHMYTMNQYMTANARCSPVCDRCFSRRQSWPLVALWEHIKFAPPIGIVYKSLQVIDVNAIAQAISDNRIVCVAYSHIAIIPQRPVGTSRCSLGWLERQLGFSELFRSVFSISIIVYCLYHHHHHILFSSQYGNHKSVQ